MPPVKIYGIKNCDTMKKAFAWLDDRGVAYDFHDYKKEGADSAVLRNAIAAHGWENVINRKGTSWRALPDPLKAAMTAKTAQDAALENPSLIRRPLVVRGEDISLGFSPEDFERMFG